MRRGKRTLGSSLDSRAEITSKVSARDHLVIIGILPNVKSTNLNRSVSSAISARLCTGKLKVKTAKKKRENMVTKVQWLYLEDARQLGYVFKDTEPLESSPILRKSTQVLRSTRRIRFTKASQRHANIRESNGPSLGKIQIKNFHQPSPNALKFEDRSQEEIEDKSDEPRRRVETCQEHLKSQRNGQSNLLLTRIGIVYNMEIHQKKAGPDNHRLKTMVKRSTEQNLRIKNF